MALPIVWIVAGVAATAVAVGVLRRKPGAGPAGYELRPKLLAFGDRFVQPAPTLVRGFSIQQGPRIVSGPPQIPADVLAVVATRVLYAGAFDSYIPELKQIAQMGPAAESYRGTITTRIWHGLAVGMEGIPKGKAGWAGQNLRFNTIAVAVQNELNRTDPLPSSVFSAYPMLRPMLNYPVRSIESLPPPAQWLCYRYVQLTEGPGCDDWGSVWTQGHTTADIYKRAPNAAGTSEAGCRSLRSSRYEWMFRKLEALLAGAFSDESFTDQLARKVLETAKDKIVIWPGGPASSPYVDWGYLVGWLVRAYAAAQSGDIDELSDLGAEAGQTARDWGERPPGEDYGSAEMASDLQAFAGELAAGS